MTNQKSKSGKLAAILLILIGGCVTNAGAGVMPVAGGYEVSYHMELYAGTQTGKNIKDVFIFEWDASNSSVDGTYEIEASGPTNWSHTIGFAPTSALAIGYLDGEAGVGDGKRHIYTLFSAAYHDYLVANFLGFKFSEIFGQGEQFTIDLITDAAGGNLAALASLETFVRDEMSGGAFDPNGGFRILKWSVLPPVEEGGNIPEPSTVAIFILGLAGLMARRRARES
jgi:hypothetical protein